MNPSSSGSRIPDSAAPTKPTGASSRRIRGLVFENNGSEVDPQFVQLAVGGAFVAQEVVPVDAGDRVVAEYGHTFDEPGTYDVRLNDERIGTVEVTESTNAMPDDSENETPGEPPAREPGGGGLGMPGFGVPVALLALLVAVGARVVGR